MEYRNDGNIAIEVGQTITLGYSIGNNIISVPKLLSSPLNPGEIISQNFSDIKSNITIGSANTIEFYGKVNNDIQASNDAIIISMTVYQSPTLDIGKGKTKIFDGSTSIDAGGGNDIYTWSTGATVRSISVNKTGWYKVTVTSRDGCVASDSVYLLNINDGNSILSIITGTFEVFPNPAQKVIRIRNISETLVNPVIQIVSSENKLLFKKKYQQVFSKFDESIDVSSFARGMYYLKIMDSKGIVFVEKVVLY
jgi:hypothetical protein